LPCSSPHLSPRAEAHSFESTQPKAMCSVPIAQKALRIDPLSIDDEKASLNRTMSLVGDENTYRDTLSSPRAAHASGQDLRTLSLMTRTVLKWLNEDLPGNAIPIPPNMIKDNASADRARSPLKCSLTARIRPDMTCLPNEGRQPSMVIELSGTRLHPKIKLSCRMTDGLPPVHEEGSPSTTKQLLSREAVNGEETSEMQRLPIPSAALSLHERMPTSYMRATPSRLSRVESKLAVMPLVVPKRHSPTNIVNTKSTARASTRPVTKPDTRLREPDKAIIRSSVVSPSPGEALATQPPNEASLSMRQPGNRKVVNKEQTRSLRRPPVPLATRSLLRSLPASSIQDRPARPPSSNHKPLPLPVVARPVEQPKEIGFIAKGPANVVPCSPKMPKPLPDWQMRASSSRPPGNEPRQPHMVVPKPISSIQATTTKWPRSKAAINGDRACTSDHPHIAPVDPRPPKPSPIQRAQATPIRPLNDELQLPVGMTSIQAQASNLPNKVREERCTAYVLLPASFARGYREHQRRYSAPVRTQPPAVPAQRPIRSRSLSLHSSSTDLSYQTAPTNISSSQQPQDEFSNTPSETQPNTLTTPLTLRGVLKWKVRKCRSSIKAWIDNAIGGFIWRLSQTTGRPTLSMTA
jgi:hypothetical protein